MIACASRQQAYDLFRFLERHRPRHSPAPRLLLGETPRATREEGPRCLRAGHLRHAGPGRRADRGLDFAPMQAPDRLVTVRVPASRATQKYFRAMTRSGDDEAHLFVVLPSHLPRAPPVLPMELFGQAGEYAMGELVGDTESGDSRARPVHRYKRSPIHGRLVAPAHARCHPLWHGRTWSAAIGRRSRRCSQAARSSPLMLRRHLIVSAG